MRSLTNPRIGELRRARVVERLSPREYIVSFAGELLRVSNDTARVWRPGQDVDLIVISVNPVAFRLLEPRGPGRIDTLV
jgi:hypothetical protein